MKHMSIEVDSPIILKADFEYISTSKPSRAIIPIIIGREYDQINHNLWEICEPIINVNRQQLKSELFKFNRHPGIGTYSLYYDNNEVLGLALSGEMYNDIEYCQIQMRYDDNMIPYINMKTTPMNMMYRIVQEIS